MHKFSSSDSLPKLCLIVSSIGTFNYNLTSFLCDLLSPLVPNDYFCKDLIKNAYLPFLIDKVIKKYLDCTFFLVTKLN